VHPLPDGNIIKYRAFGSRGLHIVAGNGPGLGVVTLARTAITRSDCIIKAPSNDPFTSAVLAMTMCDMAPDHPITKHFAVAYWRGGDAEVEDKLYQPHNIDEITAWGGLAGLKHVTKYLQPGLELIALDPLTSISIVGPEALEGGEQMNEAARRLAIDIGAGNQLGCASSRVTYVLTGSHPDGVERVIEFGKVVYQAIMDLPPTFSTVPKSYDKELKAHVDALRLDDEWYEVIGGSRDQGAIIVSKLPRKVDCPAYLTDRTANFCSGRVDRRHSPGHLRLHANDRRVARAAQSRTGECGAVLWRPEAGDPRQRSLQRSPRRSGPRRH
jgi:Acyl-CoA reductase (LuxC)